MGCEERYHEFKTCTCYTLHVTKRRAITIERTAGVNIECIDCWRESSAKESHHRSIENDSKRTSSDERGFTTRVASCTTTNTSTQASKTWATPSIFDKQRKSQELRVSFSLISMRRMHKKQFYHNAFETRRKYCDRRSIALPKRSKANDFPLDILF